MATRAHVEIQVKQDLAIAENVFKESLANSERQLYSTTKLLASDNDLKRAIKLKDFDDLRTLLSDFRHHTDADLMTVVALDGTIIGNSDNVMANTDTLISYHLISEALEHGKKSSFISTKGKVYQVSLITIRAPHPIAVAQLGYEINTSWVERLKAVTNLDVTINAEKYQQHVARVSTLPKGIVHNQSIKTSYEPLSLFKKNHYVSKTFSLTNLDTSEINVTLAENTDKFFNLFSVLQYRVFITTLIALGLAIIFIILFSRKLTKPLSLLAGKSAAIADGDYDCTLDVHAHYKEVHKLADAFEKMKKNIKDREDKITYQADHDLVTGLFNRLSISSIIEDKLSKREPFSILGINIDDIRNINDAFGYTIGDTCILGLAKRLQSIDGIPARINGSEMLVVLNQPMQHDEVIALKNVLKRPFISDSLIISIKLSACYLELPKDANTLEQTFRRLSLSLDKAEFSKNNFMMYSDHFEAEHLQRLEILENLKQALASKKSEFFVVYQPKISFNQKGIVKSEALIRWKNEAFGFVGPDQFIPIAEQSGLIHQITQLVILTVINDLAEWRREGIDHQVAVNLSAYDVENPTLLNWILAELSCLSLPNYCLSFEITESSLMKDPKKGLEYLNAFKQAGFELFIDDFGTGYSSLSYIKYMPVTAIKIDRGFIIDLCHHPEDQKIVKTILMLAKHFNLEVVAEGIETQEALELLASWGCEWGQGYHISRPIEATCFKQWLQDHKGDQLKVMGEQ